MQREIKSSTRVVKKLLFMFVTVGIISNAFSGFASPTFATDQSVTGGSTTSEGAGSLNPLSLGTVDSSIPAIPPTIVLPSDLKSDDRAALPSLLQLLNQQSDAKIFAELVKASGLEHVLSGSFKVTALVPPDGSFSPKLLEILRSPDRHALAKNFVASHLIWGDIRASETQDVRLSGSIQGRSLVMRWIGKTLHVSLVGAEVIVISADHPANNGIMHSVDRPLVSGLLARALAGGDQTTEELVTDAEADSSGGLRHAAGCSSGSNQSASNQDGRGRSGSGVESKQELTTSTATQSDGALSPQTASDSGRSRGRRPGGCGCGAD